MLWLVVHAGAQNTDLYCQVVVLSSDCAFVFVALCCCFLCSRFCILGSTELQVGSFCVRYAVILFVCSVAEMFDAFIVHHSALSP